MKPLTAHSLVSGNIELFSLPDIYFQVSEMINDPRFSFEDIGQVVGKDPALTARLLKVVNSPFYGLPAKIDTISRAIVVIGTEELKALILATSVVDSFKHIPAELVDMTSFWMRSVHCAVTCRLLARESLMLHYERLFIIGLLHDIGSLVLYSTLANESREVLLAAENDRSRIPELEQQIIGFNHAEVGSELLKCWGLPKSLYEAVGCYLKPAMAVAHRLEAMLLSLAVQLVDAAEKCESPEAVAEFVLAQQTEPDVRLSTDQIVDISTKAGKEFSHVFELIAPNKRFH